MNAQTGSRRCWMPHNRQESKIQNSKQNNKNKTTKTKKEEKKIENKRGGNLPSRRRNQPATPPVSDGQHQHQHQHQHLQVQPKLLKFHFIINPNPPLQRFCYRLNRQFVWKDRRMKMDRFVLVAAVSLLSSAFCHLTGEISHFRHLSSDVGVAAADVSTHSGVDKCCERQQRKRFIGYGLDGEQLFVDEGQCRQMCPTKKKKIHRRQFEALLKANRTVDPVQVNSSSNYIADFNFL